VLIIYVNKKVSKSVLLKLIKKSYAVRLFGEFREPQHYALNAKNSVFVLNFSESFFEMDKNNCPFFIFPK
jgi:alpha-D-ribose 1-methylphosphonate 5-phosphate C-P lyase